MQNLLGYGSKGAIADGTITGYVEGASLSWVDADDVARVAAAVLLEPAGHEGKTYRLGYDAKSYYEIAEIMTAVVGRPFRYEASDPDNFREAMRLAGADMAYMDCVYEHWKRHAAGTIPDAAATFDNFREITGVAPTDWVEFVRKHREQLSY